MRLPTEDLRTFVPAILEGTLLWAEDSKNKFRLKVRIILERLARRCGFEALEPHFPESHRALLTHIRKQTTRKERKRSEADSQVRGEGQRMVCLCLYGWSLCSRLKYRVHFKHVGPAVSTQ